jgi:hypothetical protein
MVVLEVRYRYSCQNESGSENIIIKTTHIVVGTSFKSLKLFIAIKDRRKAAFSDSRKLRGNKPWKVDKDEKRGN